MTRSAKGTIEEPGRNVAAKSGLNRAMLDAGFGRLATLG
jgi:putative transposase